MPHPPARPLVGVVVVSSDDMVGLEAKVALVAGSLGLEPIPGRTAVRTPGTRAVSIGAVRSAASRLHSALAATGVNKPWVGAAIASGLAAAERAAADAISLSRGRRRPGPVFYDDVLLEEILTSNPELMYRLASLLIPVAGSHGAAKNGQPLLAALESYLECGFSTSGAARALGLHRHTIEYRMRLLRSALGRSIRGPDGLLLWLAVRAQRMLERAQTP